MFVQSEPWVWGGDLSNTLLLNYRSLPIEVTHCTFKPNKIVCKKTVSVKIVILDFLEIRCFVLNVLSVELLITLLTTADLLLHC